MSQEDRERWDTKHAAARGVSLESPDPLVLEAVQEAGLSAGSRVLDLASGRGRHALAFARLGFEVSAWDVSDEALAQLSRSASAESLPVRTKRVDVDHLGSETIDDSFDLICVVNFLDRTLPAKLRSSLAPGGALLLCTFTDDSPGRHPSQRHRLRPGELSAGWERFESKFYVERDGRAVLLANVLEE